MITDEMATAAAKAIHEYDKRDTWDDEGCNDTGPPGFEFPSCKEWTTGMARAALEAVEPLIRQQTAEAIAGAITEAAERKAVHPAVEVDDAYYRACNDAVEIAREYGKGDPK